MALRENTNFGKRVYLKISGNGSLYESSREPRDGFEAHTNEKTGSVSYWKEYFNGVEGYLEACLIDTREFDGHTVKYVTWYISDETETCVISTPLSYSDGRMNSYVKSFVKYIPNIDLSRKILFQPQRKKSTDKYAPGGLWLLYSGTDRKEKDELISCYYKKGQNGWPDIEEKLSMTGEKKYDSSNQDNFAFKVLSDFVEKVKAFANANPELYQKAPREEVSTVSSGNPTTKAEARREDPPVQAEAQWPQTASMFDNSNDDLPF